MTDVRRKKKGHSQPTVKLPPESLFREADALDISSLIDGMKETTVKVLESVPAPKNKIVIRKLSHADAMRIYDMQQRDSARASALMVVYGCAKPKMTVEEVMAMPSGVVGEIAGLVSDFSGISDEGREGAAGLLKQTKDTGS